LLSPRALYIVIPSIWLTTDKGTVPRRAGRRERKSGEERESAFSVCFFFAAVPFLLLLGLLDVLLLHSPHLILFGRLLTATSVASRQK